MRKPRPLPPELGEVFAVSEAIELGVSRDRLDRTDLVAPFHGVRLVGHPPPKGDAYAVAHAELLERCTAYQAVAPAGFAFSHVTAARIYGMPLPARLERRVALDVTVPAGAPQPRGRGVVGHRAQYLDVRCVMALPVAAPERIWLELAAMLPVDDLVVAGDFLVRRKCPLSTVGALRDAVSTMHRMRGAIVARRAIEDVRAGTDSPPESRLRLVIVRGGLPEPVVGYTVFDSDHYFVGTPDLAYVAEAIAIEYEGDGHRTDPRVFRDDIARRELFELAQWRVLRVTGDDLRDPPYLLERVRRLLAQRATPGPVR